jgi:hypothetical protein
VEIAELWEGVLERGGSDQFGNGFVLHVIAELAEEAHQRSHFVVDCSDEVSGSCSRDAESI